MIHVTLLYSTAALYVMGEATEKWSGEEIILFISNTANWKLVKMLTQNITINMLTKLRNSIE